MIKSAEFESDFKIKLTEFVEKLKREAAPRGRIVRSVNVNKVRDFVYVVNADVIIYGMRMLPERHVYTVMYNPKSEEYMWHSGFPDEPDQERTVN